MQSVCFRTVRLCSSKSTPRVKTGHLTKQLDLTYNMVVRDLRDQNPKQMAVSSASTCRRKVIESRSVTFSRLCVSLVLLENKMKFSSNSSDGHLQMLGKEQ